MIAGRKPRNVATVKIVESTSDVMYMEHEYTYVQKSQARITHISELIKCVQ